ncbi:MAG TPA: hypothetical protein VFL41_12290 [Gaiellaceae bacterium]|nr:hypothetical protein [Gaiellaceae bacterium]HET8652608.1 hypothetical protein [Gaiellaceae bacterium]
MRWAAFATVAAGVVAALSVAQLATGQTIDRVRVAPNPPVASIPEGLTLVIGSPDAYSRVSASGGRGSWVGPPYAPLGAPNAWGNASIDWEVGFDTRQLDTERIALANLTRDWQEDQRAGVSVPHVVGGRVVGDVPGSFVLQVQRQSAPSELVVAFPLSRDLHAYVRFLLLRPETNDFYVNGSIKASSWNRGQALVAMARVKLEGNLPPSLVSIRARRGGRVVSGFALDFLRHAVVGIPVTLERKRGRGWRRVSTVRTSRLGGYSFRVAPGTYRARARLGARFAATSSVVRARAAR